MKTLYDLCLELTSFINIANSERVLAKKSRVNTDNNSEFNKLVEEYKEGIWDDDIATLWVEMMILA